MQHTIDISEYVMWCGGVVVWWCGGVQSVVAVRALEHAGFCMERDVGAVCIGEWLMRRRVS